MKKFIALLFGLFTIVASAQQIDAQTGNIVYTTLNPPPPGSPHTWGGFINYNTGGGGLQGGNVPAYNSQTGTFVFGYAQGTVAYTNAVNFALANAGTGIKVNGFKYSWQYFNQDYSRGTLSGNISLTSNTGSILQSYNFNMPQTTEGWTTMSGTKNFNTQYALSGLGNLQVSFTGKDDRFWAGYYGPQIRDIDVRLLYSVKASSFSNWSSLTGENGTFTLSSPGMVRYGAENTYVYQNYQPGTYECSNGAWGQDPIGGVYKSCSLGTVATYSPPPTTTTTTNNITTTTESIIAAAAEPILLAPVTTTTTASTTGATSDPVSTTSTTTSSAPQSSPTATTTTSSSNTTASTTTTATVATTPVATVASTPSSGSSRTVDGTSIGLSVVARNQQRDQTIAMQASQNAIQSANEVANQVTQEAQSIASQAVSNSFSVAQPAMKSTTNSVEVKTTAGNTDLTFQNNQSSSSMSLFAGPTIVTNTQKQTDNQQMIVASTAPTTQTTKTNQSSQQVETVTSSDRNTNTVMLNNVTSIVDVDNRPTLNNQIRSVNSSTVTAAPTEVVTQQTPPTYNLLPPVVSISTQITSVQSYKLIPDKETSTVEKEKLQETVYTPTIANNLLLPPKQEMSQINIQPVFATAIQNNSISMNTSQPVIQVTNDVSMSDSQKMLLDRSNPLFQTLENKNIETQNNMVAQQGPVVNRNAQNNEAAGNVDINRMATAPAGYNEYLKMTLRDAAFYAPKEVYANQRTVDNARALRALSSDRLHQQLVNLQYERK